MGVTSVACVRASLLHSVRESPREDAILPLVTRHGALGVEVARWSGWRSLDGQGGGR